MENEKFIINVKHEVYPHLKNGNKTIEVRFHSDKLDKLKPGQKIYFKSFHHPELPKTISKIETYPTLKEALDKLPVGQIAPGFTSQRGIMEKLREYYPHIKKQQNQKVIVLHLK